VELDGPDDCAASFRRSFVLRVASSVDRRVPDNGGRASGASGLAGCVSGYGGRGVVAHPATGTKSVQKAKILKNMASIRRLLNEMTAGGVRLLGVEIVLCAFAGSTRGTRSNPK
jgi:hypothetical protein